MGRYILVSFMFIFVGEITEGAEPISGNSVIRGKAGRSEIVITTTSRLAGAIHSLTWDGVEFIDSYDHGRQLQSASNFDSAQKFIPEVYNPTEAGSASDGTGNRSTSRLLQIETKGTELRTRNQMAFWLAPHEKSQGNPARNQQRLSDHLLSKTVQIGYKDYPHVIDYRVVFTVPAEKHTYAQFEALTGYMPVAFSKFWAWNRAKKTWELLDDGPGEQREPLIFSKEKGTHAMGIFSPDQPSKGFEGAGYGRFRFKAEKVNKWNCVFRIRSKDGIAAGDYPYRMFVVVGTLEDVQSTMQRLFTEFAR